MTEIILAAIDQKRESEERASGNEVRLRWHTHGSPGLGRCDVVDVVLSSAFPI